MANRIRRQFLQWKVIALIVDTNIMIWALYDPERLPISLREALDDPKSAPAFSTISVWEISIKAARHAGFDVDARISRQALLSAGWRELVFNSEHAIAVGSLPDIHGDPFDRALLAQALIEKEHLVTADRKMSVYGNYVKLIKPIKNGER
jgi:PIN domain nuclease of toxin-antitoxin system